MRFNKWTRQIHRWLSVVFTLLVVANFVANGLKMDAKYTMPLGFVTLVPLFLLLFTGLYLFALPWLPARRASPA